MLGLIFAWFMATIIVGEWAKKTYGPDARSDVWAFSWSSIICYVITIGIFII